MSTAGKGSAGSASTADVQEEFLDKAKKTIQAEAFYMKRCLDGSKLMDALKHASNMVGQLRTSILSPKQYYDLYISCFDQLKYLETFLIDEKERGGMKMSKLYELVQYAGNVLPRLYLLVTVGSAYVRSEEASAKDILYDMVEMCRGVQHPLRGLFLRNYLSEMTKDKLPDTGNRYETKGGSVSDSIEFILANFTEMNKLWVRMEPQKGSVLPREREQKQRERADLRLLVGKNLARLGQLEGVDVDHYRDILPRILKQVVNCKEKIAQEYLMECIVQIFPDEYHLLTLDELLDTCLKLDPTVDLKVVIVSLLERLSNFVVRNSATAESVSVVPVSGREREVNVFRTIFDKIRIIFEELPKESVTTPADKIQILVALVSLSLKYYPKSVSNVNEVLQLTATVLEKVGKQGCDDARIRKNIVSLLNIPLKAFSVVVVLDLNMLDILGFLDYNTRKRVSVDFTKSIIEHQTVISQPDTVAKLFRFISPLIEDQDDQPIEKDVDADEFAYEQNLVASVLHRIRGEEAITSFKLCALSKKLLVTPQATPQRYVHTLVPIIFKVLELCKLLYSLEGGEEDWARRGKEIFQFVYRSVVQVKEHRPEQALKLFLQAAQCASHVGFDMIANDFLCESLILYEDLDHSDDQKKCLVLIASTLLSLKGIEEEKYDALTTKCAHHSARLLKKPDQCRLILLSSHLFSKTAGDGTVEDRFTLDCLQKSLRIADSCFETPIKVQLFVEILNKCLYFFVNKSSTITAPFLKSLIGLIKTNIAAEQAAIEADTTRFYQNTVSFIEQLKANDDTARFGEIEL
mmetsp:Transcript_29150/g.81545  ORF Transcript_29150/g.81545 Transcript_29150/m.81545 type:complete len:805 (+) Transcript_29150:29-2443(+)